MGNKNVTDKKWEFNSLYRVRVRVPKERIIKNSSNGSKR